MRVIAGSAKRLQLKTPDGMGTRPTTDRIKETLFNMIDPWIADCQFLDLFSGSGGIGIEALSRGAAGAVFVEKNPKAVSIIKENLAHTRLSDRAVVIASDVISALRRLDGSHQFDYIFMDPPYDHSLEKDVLNILRTTDLLAENGMIIIEASLDTVLSGPELDGYRIVKEKIYKTNKHIFVEADSEESEE